MRLVAEKRYVQDDAISETLLFWNVGVAAVSFTGWAAGVTDRLLIRSGPTGTEVTHLDCIPFGVLGAGWTVGGPVIGPIVSVAWGVGASTYRGTLRFWDEEFEPFGRVPVAQATEAGILPGEFSTPISVNVLQTWLKNYGALNICDETHATEARVALLGVQGEWGEVDGGAAAGVPVFTAFAAVESCDSFQYRVHNGSMNNLTVRKRIVGSAKA